MSNSYIRDKRSPHPMNDSVSKSMSSNRAKNTTPELVLRKNLWVRGGRGYRLHPANVPGKPDICFIGKKVALFIHGCYWHRCPHCNLPLPQHNQEFWKEKFRRNNERDERKKRQLEKDGWKVMVIWECEVKKKLDLVIDKVLNTISA